MTQESVLARAMERTSRDPGLSEGERGGKGAGTVGS